MVLWCYKSGVVTMGTSETKLNMMKDVDLEI